MAQLIQDTTIDLYNNYIAITIVGCLSQAYYYGHGQLYNNYLSWIQPLVNVQCYNNKYVDKISLQAW